jgi:hypothetical protein
MRANQSPRLLTHDERKAAEAAFAGRPFDPSWSNAARAVYDGILAARGLPQPPMPAVQPEPAAVATGEPRPSAQPSDSTSLPEPPPGATDSSAVPPQPQILSREDAIQAGALIDVTPIAHKMGIRLPVSFSRLLWEIGITAAHQVSDDELEDRVRDVLMAFRLRLASSRITGPLVEFPALLSFPPDPVPQTCILFALAHQDPNAPMALTFLLPGEISTGILPPQN